MKPVVVYNDDAAFKSHLTEFEILGELDVTSAALEVAEITGATVVPVRSSIPDALRELQRLGPDVVFDFCEGVLGVARWEMNFALALEMLGFPFTGCDPTATAICTDKGFVKRLLLTAGLPAPRGFTVAPGEAVPVDSIGFPVIVKPNGEDAGIGIEAAAVCRTVQELENRVRWVNEHYQQTALVEEFIDGAELNQSLYYRRGEIVTLPPGEIVFANALAPEERVVGWKAKWATGSEEDLATSSRTPAQIDDSTRAELASLCVAAAEMLDLEGYARFDVRQRASGELLIVDINPNPDISRNTGFRKALDAAGIPFPDFLQELMIEAVARKRA